MLALEAKPLGLLIMDCGLLILGRKQSAVNFKLQVVSYRMLSYVRLAKNCMM